MPSIKNAHFLNSALERKYAVTAWVYDILNFPWELRYRKWRAHLLQDIHGRVLEIGVGTGLNLASYPKDVYLTGVDLSQAMLNRAERRLKYAKCRVELKKTDVTHMANIQSSTYDWLIGTFVCCIIPDELHSLAIEEFQRILKPGGKFLLLEIIYSKKPVIRRRQKLFSGLLGKLYGVHFDRPTLQNIEAARNLEVTSTSFLKDDTYLLIKGKRL